MSHKSKIESIQHSWRGKQGSRTIRSIRRCSFLNPMVTHSSTKAACLTSFHMATLLLKGTWRCHWSPFPQSIHNGRVWADNQMDQCRLVCLSRTMKDGPVVRLARQLGSLWVPMLPDVVSIIVSEEVPTPGTHGHTI